MTVILILLGSLLGVGSLLYAHHKLSGKEGKAGEGDEISPKTEEKPPILSHAKSEAAGICCGMHAVCEKFPPAKAKSPEYYEDEELDRYRGRAADQYKREEADQFRDVLETMLPTDYRGWAESLEERGIEMPSEVKDEYMMLLEESLKKESGQ